MNLEKTEENLKGLTKEYTKYAKDCFKEFPVMGAVASAVWLTAAGVTYSMAKTVQAAKKLHP